MLYNDKCIVMQYKNYVSFSLSQDLMIVDCKQYGKEEGKQDVESKMEELLIEKQRKIEEKRLVQFDTNCTLNLI